jgi:hypothetical protein
MSRKLDAEKNFVLYHTQAGNARRLWMPDIDKRVDAEHFLLSIFFDARVGRGSLDGAQAQSCDYRSSSVILPVAKGLPHFFIAGRQWVLWLWTPSNSALMPFCG